MNGWTRATMLGGLQVLLCVLVQGDGVRGTDLLLEEPEDEETGSEDRARLRRAIDGLWSGRPAERRDIVEDPDDVFDLLDCDAEECDRRDVTSIVRSLRSLLQAERDDWITSRLLETLSLVDSPALAPLFQDALDNRSPNVRWRAIQFYAEEPSDEVRVLLEDLWRSRMRPWVRADLVKALSGLGSDIHLSDLLRLDVSDHPELLAAAIRTPGIGRLPGAVDFLAKIVRGGRPLERALALEALSSSPDSPDALRFVLDASRSSLPEVRRCALGVLGEFDSPAAGARLVEAARSDERDDARFAAIEALRNSKDPEVISLLVEILHGMPSPSFETLHPLVIRVLASIDDPSAGPGLLDLDPALGGADSFNVGALIRHLSRDRSIRGYRTRYFSGARTCHVALVNPQDGEVRRVAPAPGAGSIRCWSAPGVSGDPREHRRLMAGTLVVITDYFERNDGIWVAVDGGATDGCWTPLALLHDASEPTVGTVPGTGLMVELDLPAAETDLDAARILADRSLLRVFDPWEDVAGVVLQIDPDDEEQVMILARSRAFDGSLLDEAILELARPLARKYRGHETLEPLLRFAYQEEADDDAEFSLRR